MKLGIILLNWNAAELTAGSVRVFQGWDTLKPNVYVVDNGSTEGSLHFGERGDVPVFLLQSPTNRGFAGGNNIGIGKALEDGCTFIILINSDASISEEHVEIMLDQLRKNGDIGCLGPAIHEDDRVYIGGRDIALHVNTRNIASQKESGDEIIPVDYVPGMVFLTRREIFERIGFLDEQFFFSGEIADLCMRILKGGYLCGISPGIRADHVKEKDNPHRNSLYQYYSLRNRFLFIRKHHARIRWILEPFWVLWGIQRYIRAVFSGMDGESQAYRMAIVDGVRGIFGDRNDRFFV